MVDIGAAVGQMVNSGAFGTAMYWLGYGLLCLVLIGVMVLTYYFITFRVKAVVFPVHGSTQEGVFSIGKPKKNRVRWLKNKTSWRKLWPIFNTKEIEPFAAEHIYPGNRIYVFDINNEWIPARIDISKVDKTYKAEINPVPYFVRNWQGLQYQRNAVEYANTGWWDENKQFVFAFLTVLICLAAMLIAIWFTYKYLAPGRADLASFTAALKSAGTVPAIGPH